MRESPYLNPVAGGRDQAQLAQGNGHIGRGSVGSAVHERDRVRVVRLVDGRDRAGPDFDALVLRKKKENCQLEELRRDRGALTL